MKPTPITADTRLSILWEQRLCTDDYRSYGPICYPLIFPCGTDGFQPGSAHRQGRRRVKQFYAFMRMKRLNSFNS